MLSAPKPMPTRKTLIQAQSRRHYEYTCSLLAMIRDLREKLEIVTRERDMLTKHLNACPGEGSDEQRAGTPGILPGLEHPRV